MAVMEVDSGDDMDAIVHGLPIWKQGYAHIVPEVNWIPLRPYENWSKQLEALASVDESRQTLTPCPASCRGEPHSTWCFRQNLVTRSQISLGSSNIG